MPYTDPHNYFLLYGDGPAKRSDLLGEAISLISTASHNLEMAEQMFERAGGVGEAVANCQVARDMADTARAKAMPARYQAALDDHPDYDYPPRGWLGYLMKSEVCDTVDGDIYGDWKQNFPPAKDASTQATPSEDKKTQANLLGPRRWRRRFRSKRQKADTAVQELPPSSTGSSSSLDFLTIHEQMREQMQSITREEYRTHIKPYLWRPRR